MTSDAPGPHPLSLLLRLEARRLADPFRHPRVGAWISVVLPAALGLAALWLGAESVRPDLRDGDGAIGMGLVISGPIAFWAYPILFRPSDDGLLRRLGIPARASYGLRAMRLGVLAAAVVLLALVPFAATGVLGIGPVAVAVTAGVVGWGASLSSLAGAAARVAAPGRGIELTSRLMGPDPELVRAGPLVWAPLKPVVAAALAARLVPVDALPPAGWVAVFVVAAGLMAMRGSRRFERAAPRFSPQAAEMAYAPEPRTGEAGLVIGRGLARVLPPRAGAVRARDAAVVDRRFRWAGRVAWPVGIVCVLALLRAGERVEVQGWVAFAGAVVLAMQAMAIVGLGRMERGGRRWLDRAVGLRTADRLLGRWAAAFGMALAMVIPVGIVWALIVPGSTGWLWPAAAAGSAAVASAASLAAAGR